MRMLTSNDKGAIDRELVDHHDLGPANIMSIPDHDRGGTSTHFQYVNEVKLLKTSSGRPVFSLMKFASFSSSTRCLGSKFNPPTPTWNLPGASLGRMLIL